MSDLNNDEVEDEVLDQEAEDAASGADPKTAKIIEKLRKENARRRVENKTLHQTIETLEPLRTQVAELTDKLTDAEARRQAEEQRYNSVIESIQKSNETLVNGLPEDVQAIVPKGLGALELRQWLDVAAPVLTGKRTAPLPEGGAGNRDRAPGAALSEQQLQTAKKLGISPDDYAKQIIKR